MSRGFAFSECWSFVKRLKDYLLPFARLWVLQSIWQFEAEVAPPLLQAATWSASISAKVQILALLESSPRAQSGQLDSWLSLAAAELSDLLTAKIPIAF